jgi:hypothetical protein
MKNFKKLQIFERCQFYSLIGVSSSSFTILSSNLLSAHIFLFKFFFFSVYHSPNWFQFRILFIHRNNQSPSVYNAKNTIVISLLTIMIIGHLF